MATQTVARRCRFYLGYLLLALGLCSGRGSLVRAEPPVPPPLTAEQKARLKERDRYAAEADKLWQAGKHAEAIAAWEKKVGVEREVLGELHDEVFRALGILARLHEARDDFTAARKVRQAILAGRIKQHGEKDWRVTDARLDLKDLEHRATLDATQRGRLREAYALNQKVFHLWQAGRSREALPLALRGVAMLREILGENHRNYAQSLFNLAAQYKALNQFHKAEQLYQQARALRRKILGENHPDYAASLDNLALLYMDMGDYPKALPLYEQACAIRKQALGESHLDYATSLISLAALYYHMGDYAQALPFYQQARAIREKVLGESHADYAICLNDLAALYQAMEDYPEALRLYQQARAIVQKTVGESHPKYATCLNNLAALYQATGDYPEALRLYRQARAIDQKTVGESHPAYATRLNNLAELHRVMGDYPEALRLHQQARAILQEAVGESHPEYATCLNNLAGLYRFMGDYAKALPLYQQARAIQKNVLGESHPDYANSLSGLAALYQAMGDYPNALPLYQQASAIRGKVFGEDRLAYAHSLNDLAALYQAMGDYARALPLFEQARDLRRKVLGESHPDYGASLNNLAALYQAMRDYPKALRLYQQACAIYQEAVGESHPEYATCLNNLGALYQDMGDNAQALRLFEQARNLRRRALGENHPDYAASLHNLAHLYWLMSQADKATPLRKRLLTIHEAFLDKTFTAQSSRQRLDFLGQLRVSLDLYISLVPEAVIPASELYDHVLAWKGALFARHAEEQLARDRPELRPLVEELRQASAGLAHLAGQRPATAAQQANWRQRFRDLEKTKEDLEVRLARESDTFRRARELRRATAGQVVQALPPHIALIDFLQYTHFSRPPEVKGPEKRERQFVAFVLVRGRDPVEVPLGQAAAIEQTVQAWRRAVERGKSPDQEGDELARLVWRKLQPHLAGARTVLIAPDGALCGLPFGALPGSRKGSYLLEELAIGYVISGRHLLELAGGPTDRPGAGLLALGDLDYGPATAAPPTPGLPAYLRKPLWKPLPGTRGEVEEVTQTFRRAFPQEKPPRRLSGSEGDASRLKRELSPEAKGPHWRYLHLASHGYFEPPPPQATRQQPPERVGTFGEERERLTYQRNPLLLSGLVLAGANRRPDEGVLTAEEVSRLDLRGLDLAVLSACETGLGKVAGGEGVLGLQRAFQGAGARSLAVSLWRVDDAATALLMEEFYANLWHKKLPKLEALRQAQLTVLQHPERVVRRQKELLAQRGRTEGVRVRGPAKAPEDLPDGGRADPASPRRSPVAWWAAFVLSGDWR